VPIEYEPARAPKPVWKLLEEKKSPASARGFRLTVTIYINNSYSTFDIIQYMCNR